MAYPNVIEAFFLIRFFLTFDLFSNSVYCEAIIPITKCCASDESYAIGFDYCKPANESLNRSYPPIYSSDVEIALDAPQIQLTFNLSTCPDGFVHSAVSTNFFLFENGSLSIPELGISRPHGEFCVDEFESLDESLDPVLKPTARICIPDPCLGTSNCVRKCCPQEMILYLSSGNRDFHCRHSETIKLNYSTLVYNSSGTDDNSRPLIETGSDEPYVVHSAAGPKCENHEFDITPEPLEGNKKEPFFTMKNGSAFIQGLKQVSDRYCIESLHSNLEDGKEVQSNSLMGILCFAIEEEPDPLLRVAYPYILFVSSLFLIATFVVYALVPEMRNVHGLRVMCQVAATTVTFICLGTVQLLPSFSFPGPLCITIAILLHFSFLSIFSWLNVISFYTWWIFRHLQPNARSRDRDGTTQFLFCSIYGWGLPFIYVVTGQILDGSYDRKYDEEQQGIPLISDDDIIRPDFGVYRCWFPNKTSLIVYLYGPIGVLIGANFILFALTIFALCKATWGTMVVRKNQANQKFRVIFSLFILMGLFWLMEVISFFVSGTSEIWIVIDIVNMLTGVIVFILFICKRSVWNRLKKRYPCLERVDGAIYHNYGLSWIARLFRLSRNKESGTGSSDAQAAKTPRIQETAWTPAGPAQLKQIFDVRVDMTQNN